MKSVVNINELRVPRFCARIEERLDPLEAKRVGILGLSFKADTDDLREARSLDIIRFLLERGASVRAYDPVAIPGARKIFADEGDRIDFSENAYDVARDADALVIVTEWNQFKLLNLERIKKSMNQPIIFDGRNVYSPERLKALGFEYFSIGRGSYS